MSSHRSYLNAVLRDPDTTSDTCVLHMCFARAPELADACVSVHPVVALWRWGLRAAERDVSYENSGVLSTQITILGVLESPNT